MLAAQRGQRSSHSGGLRHYKDICSLVVFVADRGIGSAENLCQGPALTGRKVWAWRRLVVEFADVGRGDREESFEVEFLGNRHGLLSIRIDELKHR